MTGIIVWLRNDLRLRDNVALSNACKDGDKVYPLYILEDDSERNWPRGSASKVWLHHSLKMLDREYRQKGSRLILRHGTAEEQIIACLEETGASAVYWNRRYEPGNVQHDKALKKNLENGHCEVKSFKANLLFEPHEIKNRQDKPYKVFTPFWKACQSLGDPPRPLPVPKHLNPPGRWP